MQTLFALNGVYFPGDGANLEYARKFTLLPDQFEERVLAALLPGSLDGLEQQYRTVCGLIDDLLALVDKIQL
jgi:hypothetical protein